MPHIGASSRGLEGWPIPNIQQTLPRLCTLKPKLFGLLDFTAGYHQTPLDPASSTAFSAVGGLYQWTRVAMGLKGSSPYFQRSMANTSPSASTRAAAPCYGLQSASKPWKTANKPSPTTRNSTSSRTIDASDYGVGGYLYSVTNGKVPIGQLSSLQLEVGSSPYSNLSAEQP